MSTSRAKRALRGADAMAAKPVLWPVGARDAPPGPPARSGAASSGCACARGMAACARAQRGFTLVELLIVLGVIALATTFVVPALQSVSGANARKAAGELAGSMRALFDMAALRHARCALTLDLDGAAWWADCGTGRAGSARAAAAGEGEGAESLEERFPDERDEEMRRLLARTELGGLPDRVVKKHALPGSARFGPVRVEGRRGAIEEGKAYVKFFAGGQAQRAYVPIVDGSNRCTIVLEPFTGRARVVPGDVEVKE
ncbi:pilus assembly FimT family protein [Anaeromyxobacter sp. SG26]|uniref:pilus assembly FimT family protein n=1 Tax=Anaeromyxobacter sp. SG26 TaxID=2925407 RepID=UPI001F567F9C|nr:type II secretion system protein [Anaeromyxobacter sp. SG26]